MDANHPPAQFNRVNIRRAHPVLYRTITVYAIGCLLLAVNFWTANPTFNPFGISKYLVGAVFFTLGVWHLFFLNVIRNLNMVRLGSTMLFFALVGWGLGNMQQSLAGKASFQLPIVYLTIATLHFLLFREPPVNPVTEKIE